MNAQVLGVSVDSQYAHLQWTRQPRNEGDQTAVCLLSAASDRITTALYNVCCGCMPFTCCGRASRAKRVSREEYV